MKDRADVVIPAMPEALPIGGLLQALDHLVLRCAGGEADGVLPDTVAPLIERIFLHEDPAARAALSAAATASGPLAALLMEDVFPAVARCLDEGWSSDRLSFVDVTLAATRLQDAARSLGRFSLAAAQRDSVLLILPPTEQHSLPAVFAADKLRRLGVPAQLVTGQSAADLVMTARRAGPSAIFITAGSYRTVARLPDLVATLRRGVPRPVPIVLGGPGVCRSDPACKRVGADLVTSDLTKALRFCDIGLPEKTNNRTTVDV